MLSKGYHPFHYIRLLLGVLAHVRFQHSVTGSSGVMVKLCKLLFARVVKWQTSTATR